MVCDVDDWASTILLSLDVIAVAAIIDFDINTKSLRKCSNLNMISIGAVAGHAVKMSLPGSVDLLLCWRSVNQSYSRCRNILSLWISA